MRSTRKWLCLLLAAAMVFALLPQIATPARAADDGGVCGDHLSWSYRASYGELIITADESFDGKMTNYSSENPAPWSEYKSAIQTVTFEGSVVSIGAWAFEGCKNLADVTLPDMVTRVGTNAFLNCALTGVTIPVSVTELEYHCFGFTSNEIGRPARIRNFKISGCAGTAAEAYATDTGLTFVTLPNPSGACGDGLTWAFDPASGELVISGTGEMPNWKGLTTGERPWHNFRVQIKQLIVESGVTALGSCAFIGCKNLQDVELPGTLTSFGGSSGNVFSGCDNLTSVNIPDGVQTLPVALFNQCTSLQYVVIPDSVTAIRDYVFRNTGLENVTIPAGVTRIGADAFDDCSDLAWIKILNPKCEIYDSETTLGDPAATTIVGFRDSTASDYAKKYGYRFEALPVSGECGDGLTWSFDPDAGELRISGTGKMWDWGEFNQPPWYDSIGAIKSVVVENGVTSIGDLAFSGCRNLTDVTIPEGVRSIGEEAFCWCYDLDGVKLPASVTSIGGGAFANCTSLTSVMIPASTKDVGINAFYHCPALTDVTVLSEDCRLYDDALTLNDPAETVIHGFKGTTAEAYANKFGYEFKEIPLSGRIGDNVTWSLDPDTGELKFTGSGEMWDWNIANPQWYDVIDMVKKATVASGITSIGSGVFLQCTQMTEVSIPDTVTSLGTQGNTFSGCYSLKDVTIPDGVEIIPFYVFTNCVSLEHVAIPDSVKTIQRLAFQGCKSLTGVTVPAGVTSIEKDAFLNCGNLTSLTILSRDCEIYDEAETLGDPTVTVIHGYQGSTAEAYAKKYGYSFEDISDPGGTFGNGLTWTINRETGELIITGSGPMPEWDWPEDAPWYKYRDLIETVTVCSGITSVGSNAFSTCPMTELTLPDGLQQIGDHAFSACTNLQSVVIPGSVKRIDDYAFHACHSLTSVFIPEGVQSIGQYAFAVCLALSGTTVPSSVTEIGDYAFGYIFDYDTMKPARYGEFVIRGYVGTAAEAFANANDIRFEALPDPSGKCGDNLTWTFDPTTGELAITGTGAMWEWPVSWDEIVTDLPPWRDLADYIRSVTISDGVTSIGSGAFIHCVNMTRLSIPDGVKTIGMSACFNCQSLESLSIPEGVTSIGEDAFFNCKQLTTVTVPASVTSIGERAFLYCAGLESITVMNKDCGIFDSELTLGSAAVNKVRGFRGSTAETYANKYGYTFEALPDACAAGHDFGPWTQSKAPTCTKPGQEIRSCTRCGTAETRELAPLGHDFQDGVCVRCGAPDPYVPSEPDRTGLDAAVTTADALQEEEYTPESFAKVREAVAAAMALPADANQDAVNAAAKAVIDAIAALQKKDEGTPFRFDDVKDESKFYFDSVYWAYGANPQITNGVDAAHFGPDRGCTRGQVVTFLWRAAGCPEPAGTETAFTDVKPGAFYEKAVAWAVEQEITNGMSPTSFAPDNTCTRGQIVTFLWRFRGKPEPASGENPFTDVTGGAFYYKAVLWAVEAKVTNGMSPTSFAPDAICTRGQIVTFLYRAVQ